MINVGFDTETHLFRYPDKANPPGVCISLAVDIDHYQLISDAPVYQVRNDGYAVALYNFDDTGKAKLMELLKNPEVRLVAHNAAFDLHVIKQLGKDMIPLIWKALKAGRISCTQVREQIYLLGTKGHLEGTNCSLAGCLLRWCDIDITACKEDDGSVRYRYEEMDGVPVQTWGSIWVDYAIDDAVYSLMVRKAQESNRAARGPGSINQEPLNVASAYALRGMEISGIRTDPKQVEELKKLYIPRYEEARRQMLELGLIREDGTVSKEAAGQMVLEICEKLGKKPQYTPAGYVSTNKEYLETLECDDPRYLAYMEYSKTLKACTTFIPQLSVERTHPGFNNIVDSLRTSCRASNYHKYQGDQANAVTKTGKPKKERAHALPAINFQQIPRDAEFRKAIIPEEGCLFIDIDYSNLEYVSAASRLAHYTGLSDLRELLNTGMNIHDALCSKIYNDIFDDNISEYEAAEILRSDEHPKKKKLKEARQYLTKQISLGVSGGLQTPTAHENLTKASVKFSNACGLTINEVRDKITVERVDSWLSYARDRFREFAKWYDSVIWQFKVETAYIWSKKLGKKIFAGFGADVCGVWLAKRTKNMISNTVLMQSISSIGAKRAMIALYEKTENFELGSVLLGSILHAIIHDEFLMSCPEEKYEECRREMADTMLSAMHSVLPDMRVGCEASVQRYWAKSSTDGFKDTEYFKFKGEELKTC